MLTTGLIFASSCSGGYNSASEQSVGVASNESQDYDKAEFTEDTAQNPKQSEKIITTIDLSFETIEFDESIDKLEDIIIEYKGYIDYSNINHNSRSYRYGQYVIRIPKDRMNEFKSQLDQIGIKTNESINNQNVTESYRDTESRLKVIEVKEGRILALLEKAEKIEDIIKLEEQLSEIIYEKEQLQRSLIGLDDNIEYTTVNLYLREVDKQTQTSGPRSSFGEKVTAALRDSLHFFIETFENLIILLIYGLPFIAIVGIIIYIVYKFIIKPRKNKNKKF